MDTTTTQYFSPNEWNRNNQRRFNQSDNSRSEWHMIYEQSRQLSKEKAVLTKSTQDTVTKNLAYKAKETFEWKRELEKTIEDITTEIQKLVLQKKRLENAMDSAQLCLIIANECLDLRKNRISSDIVEDAVQLGLLKEVDIIRTFQNLIQKSIDEAENQLRNNMASKAAMEKDWSDKWETYGLDTTCGHLLNISSGQIAYHPGPEIIPPRWSSPEELIQFTKENVLHGRNEMSCSTSLRNTIDNLLRDAAKDMRYQADVVELAFARRVAELQDTFFRLKHHLQLIVEDIALAERTINDLKLAIQEKQPAIKVSQTRLHLRNQRPNIELCKDPAHHSLIVESRQLADTVESLQNQLARAEESLRVLLETRRDIEREIAIKENSLSLDRDRCSAVRQRFPPQHKRLGY